MRLLTLLSSIAYVTEFNLFKKTAPVLQDIAGNWLLQSCSSTKVADTSRCALKITPVVTPTSHGIIDNFDNDVEFSQYVRLLPACLCKITLRGKTERENDTLQLRWREQALLDVNLLGVGINSVCSTKWLKQPVGTARELNIVHTSPHTLQLFYDDGFFIFTRAMDCDNILQMPIETFLLLQVLGEVYRTIVHHHQ